jgi:DNA-binding protein HU-beta
MNKGEFVKAVAEKANCTQKDAGIVFDSVIDTIVSVLKSGEKIQIPGFGSFELAEHPATTKINPMTKKPVKVEACKVPKFKFGKSFKANFCD